MELLGEWVMWNLVLVRLETVLVPKVPEAHKSF
jgi:hypothetical protein